MRGLWCAVFLLWQAAVNAAPPADLSIQVSVIDTSGQPVAGVRVQLKTGQNTASTATTDQAGHAEFRSLEPARYEIDATKDTFEPVQKGDLDLSQSLSVELTMVPALARRDSIEVKPRQSTRQVRRPARSTSTRLRSFQAGRPQPRTHYP